DFLTGGVDDGDHGVGAVEQGQSPGRGGIGLTDAHVLSDYSLGGRTGRRLSAWRWYHQERDLDALGKCRGLIDRIHPVERDSERLAAIEHQPVRFYCQGRQEPCGIVPLLALHQVKSLADCLDYAGEIALLKSGLATGANRLNRREVSPGLLLLSV